MFLFRETNFNFKGKVGKFSCSSGLPKGSHLYDGCWSVCDPDQEIFHQQKVCLIAWLSLQKLLITHFLQVKGQIGATHFWSLDRLLKRVLIPVTNASTWDIQVTTPCPGNETTHLARRTQGTPSIFPVTSASEGYEQKQTRSNLPTQNDCQPETTTLP